MTNRLDNLKPFQPGQSGNPKGRPKGSRNWKTIVQNLLDDEDLADRILTDKPSWWTSLPQKNFGSAIVTALMLKAVDGDHRAAEWLRKAGWEDPTDDHIQVETLLDEIDTMPSLDEQHKEVAMKAREALGTR